VKLRDALKFQMQTVRDCCCWKRTWSITGNKQWLETDKSISQVDSKASVFWL